jgi:hypothetical protein
MSGVGIEDLVNHEPPDFIRGQGGAPRVADPESPDKLITVARSSSLGDTLDDKSALTNWRIDRAMDGVAAKPELVAKVLAAKNDDRAAYTQMREEAISAGRGSYKADLGTAVHAMTDRWETEPDWDPGSPFREALTAYTAEMNRLGLKTQLIECKFVNYDAGTAGTADRLYETTEPLQVPDGSILPAGTLVIGDTKTGDSLEYSIPGYTIQLATYAGSQLYDVVNNCVLPTPPINQDWAIIMHVNVENATCEAIWVDLEVGRYGVGLANEVREWRRNWRRKEGYSLGNQRVECATVVPDAPPVEAAPPPKKTRKAAAKKAAAPVAAAPNAVRVIERTERPKMTFEQQRTDVVERLQKIREHPKAAEWILFRWPQGCLPPKQVSTEGEMNVLVQHIQRTEAEFGLSF